MGKTFSFVLTLALIVVFSGFVSASKAGITPTITDMSVCTNSFTNQLVKVTNVGAVTDTYKLTSDSAFVTFAGCTVGTVSNNEVVLGAGETAFCSVFISPLNNTAPQKYPVTLNVNSESSSDSASAKINAEVISCNAVSLAAQDAVNACAREKFSTSVIIKNLGKSAETFNTSASAPGKFDKSSVKLDSGQSATMNFEGSYEKASNNTIKFVTKSQDSFASAEETTEVRVQDCYKFTASLTQPTIPICLRKTATFDLDIKNTGDKPDVFEIKSIANLSENQIFINGSSSAAIKVTYQPDKEGKFKFNVSIKSVGTDLSKTLYAESAAKECGSILLAPQKTEGSICKGEEFTYAIDVKNNGTTADVYSLSSAKGNVSASKVTADPGQRETVYLNVNSTGFAENKTNEIIFTASAGSLKASTKLLLNVGVCHSAGVKVVPNSLTVCAPDKASFAAEITNNGLKPETFSVFAAGSRIADNVLVPQNATKTVGFVANYSNDTGIYRIDVEAVSDNLDVKSAGALVVKDYEACYGSALTSKDAKKEIAPSEKTLQELQVRNTGIKTLNYILQVMGPSWVSVGISNITLNPNETGKVYLYVAPPFGTKIGNYSTKIIAISEKGVPSNTDFTANVVGPTTTLKVVSTTTTLPAQSGGQRRTVVIGIILAIATILILRYIFTSK